MPKKGLLLLFFIIAQGVYAQNTAYFNLVNGQKFSAKILHTANKYYLVEGADGKLFEVNRNAVNSYHNESNSYTFTNRYAGISPNEFIVRNALRNEIGINVFALFSTDIQVFYEYTFLKSRLSLRFPVTFGFNNGNFNNTNTSSLQIQFPKFKNNVFGIGIEPRIRSSRFGKNSYVLGFSAEYLYINASYYTEFESMHSLRLFLNNGVAHKIGHRVKLGYDAGIGMLINPRVMQSGGNLSFIPLPQFRFRMNLSYLY